MEEFLLHGFLTNDELNIINEQDIDVTVFITKLLHGVGTVSLFITDCFDNFIDKGLTGNVYDSLGIIPVNNIIANCMHQMSLPKTGSSVNKERVVNITRFLCNLKGSSMGIIVIITNHEIVKCVFSTDKRMILTR